MLQRYLAFLDLKDYQLRSLPKDLLASPTVTFLDIPQGVAYAMIAGLPPAMGLYAAAVPAIVGALFRSSHHVVTGPTNALSFLVGGAVATEVARSGAAPMEVAVTLAFMVGVLQALAGVLRLDVVADYISHAVVRGYITGAAVLIGIGQLSNITGTPRVQGDVLEVFTTWLASLPETSPLAVLFAAGTVAFILWMRRVNRRIPASIIAMALGILLARIFSLPEAGLEAGELQTLMDRIATDPHVRVLILRMRQAEDLDVTTASVLEAASQQLAERGKTLLLLGVRSPALELLNKTGVRDHVGLENVFPTQSSWFTAMEGALQRALDLVGEHACGHACPFAEYLSEQTTLRAAVGEKKVCP